MPTRPTVQTTVGAPPLNRSNAPAVIWFRTDLRLADNPALAAAVEAGRPVVPVYILADEPTGARPLGAAARWWLAGSLDALHASLQAMGGGVAILRGRPSDVLPAVVKAVGADAVLWNRRYEKAAQDEDAGIKAALKADGVAALSYNSHLLHEPWQVRSKSGTPVKVFTPFWRAAREAGEPAAPAPPPARITFAPFAGPAAETVESLGLRPTRPNWAVEMASVWTPGEAGARAALGRFIETAARGYAENRNLPGRASTSRLSPHLRFGEIGPRQIWHAMKAAFESGYAKASERDIDKFLAEIGWREFSYHLLGQFPELAERNFQPRFDDFPWRADDAAFHAWTRGRTGYPIVDAGMRELWRIGWMHNRVRMITASFLVKHLLVDWRRGEEWFWDTLVDADPASNAASWQWVAGSGADAAPYFRIFAPVLQGEKFDPDGAYVRRYVPELAGLPNAWIHKPWAAPHPVLSQAGITLGKDYTWPIVVHEDARRRALDAFRGISGEAAE